MDRHKYGGRLYEKICNVCIAQATAIESCLSLCHPVGTNDYSERPIAACFAKDKGEF